MMRMNRLILTCALVAIATAVGLAQRAPERIELPEFQKLHAANKILVVDVRDAQSFANGHIPGAINIPLGEESEAAHAKKLQAEKRPVVTYCA
jgi:rhodanese-related sulfurtransferase